MGWWLTHDEGSEGEGHAKRARVARHPLDAIQQIHLFSKRKREDADVEPQSFVPSSKRPAVQPVMADDVGSHASSSIAEHCVPPCLVHRLAAYVSSSR